MRLPEIEAWVLSIVRAVGDGHVPEDARVELKAEWLDPPKAARRIAAHANAAGTDEILWVIGLDETRGVIAPPPVDFATWWSQVQSQFEGLAPALTDVRISTAGGDVVALLFDTRRVPFVVRNPCFGQRGGGAVELEVPWRDGTKARTARRSELLELLAPSVGVPTFEFISASAAVPCPPQAEGRIGTLDVTAYVTPRSGESVTIPYHRCGGEVRLGELCHKIVRVRMTPPWELVPRARAITSKSLTIASTDDELMVEGPGRVHITAVFEVREWPREDPEHGLAKLDFPVIHGRTVALLEFALRSKATERPSDRLLWVGDA